MKNQEKWLLLRDSLYKRIKKSKFNKVEFSEENIEKYIDKTSNLTYYLTEEDGQRFIRCFYNYQEIDFETFIKEMNTVHESSVDFGSTLWSEEK